jgi:hypothetical protein
MKVFHSERELSAELNMARFVKFAKDELVVWGTDLAFDTSSWDITKFFWRRGRPGRIVLHFEGRAVSPDCNSIDTSKFMSEIKSILRYTYGLVNWKAPPTEVAREICTAGISGISA